LLVKTVLVRPRFDLLGIHGKMMSEVEDKYKKDIKNAGGYEKFIKTLFK
jgi:hypothetical protein